MKMLRSFLCAKRKRDSAQHQMMERTGWSLTRKRFKTHSETSLASDHPVRAFSERDHFWWRGHPSFARRGICSPEFIHSFYTALGKTRSYENRDMVVDGTD